MLRSGRGDDRPGGFPGLKRRNETMTTTDDLDALTNEACNLAMAGVPHDDPRLVDLDRRTLAAWFAQAGMAPMSMAEIYTALTQRLIAIGHRAPEDAPECAATMLVGWDRFTDADSMETGGRQCDRWMDPEVLKLLDAGLHAYWLGKEPYPRAPA
jgi:hypothetical protein